MSSLVAARLGVLILQVLLPRPTEPAQPTSPVEGKENKADANDGEDIPPMSDDELSVLAIPLEEAITNEAIPPSKSNAVAQAPHPGEGADAAPPARTSDRTVRDTFPPTAPKVPSECETPAGLPSDSALAPRLLAPRWEAGAALLGGFVGFGTGHFYAGAPRRGVVMGVTDSLLVGGLFGSIWALNVHVVREDRRTGLSLARGERDRDGTESALYGLAWGLGIAAGVSRVFQAFDAYHAAARTNEELKGVSFVPLVSAGPNSGGGQLVLAWGW